MKMKEQSKYTYVPKGKGISKYDCVRCCFNRPGFGCIRPTGMHSCSAGVPGNPTNKAGWFILTPPSPKAKAKVKSPKAAKPSLEGEHLVLESTPLFGEIAFRIVKQSPQATTCALGRGPWSRTKSYAGLWICSMGYPELRRELNTKLTLFVRGTDKGKNKKIMICSKEEWARVKKGVAAFNKAVNKEG